MSTRRTARTASPSFPRLETERLLLRKIVPSDAAALYAIFSNDEVTRYYDLGTMVDPADAETMVRRMASRYRHGQAIRWGIVHKQDRAFVGTCGFHFQAAGFKAEIGYDLGREHWHQGYMSEALRAMLAYGFETLKLHRIEALVMPENEASATLLLRLGFSEEGVLREYAYFKGEYHDLCFFSLLRREANQTLGVLKP